MKDTWNSVIKKVLHAIRMRPNKWVLARDLVPDLKEARMGNSMSSRSISKYLKRLCEQNKVERRKIYPPSTIWAYKSLVPPDCCEYGKFIVNDKHCVHCGAEYK